MMEHFDIVDLPKKNVMIKFYLDDDLQKVLFGGPWIFG